RYLRDMTDAYFTTAPTRSAFHWVRERLGGQTGSVPATPVSDLDGAGSVLPELLIRSNAGDGSSAGALHELYFRLSEAEISRRINALKNNLTDDDDDSENFRELCRLEAHRREIIELIQTGAYET
ncbi:MAG: hypothetical protein ACYDG7_09955, partial [Thermoleophilia bacterium]